MMALDAYRAFAAAWYPGRDEVLLENPDLPARALRGVLSDAEVIAFFRVAEAHFPDELRQFCEAALEDVPVGTLERIRDQYHAARELFELEKEQLRRRSERRARLAVVR